MKKVFTVILFSWYIFPVFLQYIPTSINTAIYSAIPLLYFLYNYKKTLRYVYSLLECNSLCISLILLVCWSLIVVVYNQSYDLSFIGELANLIKNIIVYVFLFDLVNRVWKFDGNLKIFIDIYIVACLLYIGSTIVFLTLPELKTLWNSIIVISDFSEELTQDPTYITRYGWQGFSGFTVSFKMLIGEIFVLCLSKQNKYMTILLIVIGIANFFYGRIGGFLSLALILIYCINRLYIDGIAFGFRVIRFLIFFITMIFFAISILGNNEMVDIWFTWVSTPIVAFFDGLRYGQLNFGGSTNRLVYGMYFVPEVNTLLWGDGYYTNTDGTYYMHTDVGIMRSVLYYGIIGSIIGYGSLINYGMVVHKKIADKCNELGGLCVVLIVIAALAYEFKGLNFVIPFGVLTAMYVSREMDNSNM